MYAPGLSPMAIMDEEAGKSPLPQRRPPGPLATKVRTVVDYLTLPHLRAIVRPYRNYAIYVGIVYALLVMFTGEMVLFGSWNGGWTLIVYTWGTPWWSGAWWNFPAFVITGPGVFLQFPMLTTVTMLVSIVGVSLGTVVAAVAIRSWWALRTASRNPPSQLGTAASGVVPAIAGVSALGACCCITCVGPGVVSVVAGLSSVGTNQILDNEWYISVFQIVIIGVSLLVQEYTVRQTERGCSLAPIDRRFAGSLLLRLGLLVAGITWSLAMFVEWGEINPLTAGPSLWYHWIFEHQLLASAAMAAGFLPRESYALFRRLFRGFRSNLVRAAMVVAAITWGVGVPPSLTSMGLGGFLNELLGYFGAPAAWGAIPPDLPLGPALYFHWAFQHLLLSGFALTLAFWPARMMAFVSDSAPVPTGAAPNVQFRGIPGAG